jgi:acyl carrier protein
LNKETILAKLTSVITEQLGVDEDEVTLDARFVDDLKADSLDLVELMMSIEEFAGHELEESGSDKKFEITDEDAEKILTVNDALVLLVPVLS